MSKLKIILSLFIAVSTFVLSIIEIKEKLNELKETQI